MYAEGALNFNIYTNHKNLLQFIIIKELNRQQIRWSKELKQYTFKIHYTSEKENDRANVLNRRCDYIIIKKVFDHNILRINNGGIISANHYQINAIMCIIKYNQKQFSMNKEKLQISKNKIDEYIKKHHDDSLQKHSDVLKTLQLLQ